MNLRSRKNKHWNTVLQLPFFNSFKVWHEMIWLEFSLQWDSCYLKFSLGFRPIKTLLGFMIWWMLSDNFAEAMSKTDEESENLHQQLLDREIDLATFLQKYKKLRTNYHKRALVYLAARTSSVWQRRRGHAYLERSFLFVMWKMICVHLFVGLFFAHIGVMLWKLLSSFSLTIEILSLINKILSYV